MLGNMAVDAAAREAAQTLRVQVGVAGATARCLARLARGARRARRGRSGRVGGRAWGPGPTATQALPWGRPVRAPVRADPGHAGCGAPHGWCMTCGRAPGRGGKVVRARVVVRVRAVRCEAGWPDGCSLSLLVVSCTLGAEFDPRGHAPRRCVAGRQCERCGRALATSRLGRQRCPVLLLRFSGIRDAIGHWPREGFFDRRCR